MMKNRHLYYDDERLKIKKIILKITCLNYIKMSNYCYICCVKGQKRDLFILSYEKRRKVNLISFSHTMTVCVCMCVCVCVFMFILYAWWTVCECLGVCLANVFLTAGAASERDVGEASNSSYLFLYPFPHTDQRVLSYVCVCVCVLCQVCSAAWEIKREKVQAYILLYSNQYMFLAWNIILMLLHDITIVIIIIIIIIIIIVGFYYSYFGFVLIFVTHDGLATLTWHYVIFSSENSFRTHHNLDILLRLVKICHFISDLFSYCAKMGACPKSLIWAVCSMICI